MFTRSGKRSLAAARNAGGNRGNTPATARAPTSAPRSAAAPGRVVRAQAATPDCGALVSASAGNAGPGFVDAMTKSTSANAAAIASLAWIRRASAAAAVLRL